jgi:hypothetical protein
MLFRIMALALVYALVLVLAPSEVEGAVHAGAPAFYSSAATAGSGSFVFGR